ncbi:hypothetical protein GQ457_13G013640 [Hibiscus cannabinus]
MTKNAPIAAYTWTFESAVPACERTFLVAEMLQHTGVQNRQSAEKTKQPRYFAAHMVPLQELVELWVFDLGFQKPLSSIVCLAQPVRSAQFREPVFTRSSTVAERSRYPLDRSNLLFSGVCPICAIYLISEIYF